MRERVPQGARSPCVVADGLLLLRQGQAGEDVSDFFAVFCKLFQSALLAISAMVAPVARHRSSGERQSCTPRCPALM